MAQGGQHRQQEQQWQQQQQSGMYACYSLPPSFPSFSSKTLLISPLSTYPLFPMQSFLFPSLHSQLPHDQTDKEESAP